MRPIKSIPTLYQGIEFRSKLEADWARFFDALKIKWEYEKQGRYCGDLFVWCDFHLPEIDQWFEVKGVWTEQERAKYDAFAKAIAPDEKLFLGGPNGLLAFNSPQGDIEVAIVQGCDRCRISFFRSEPHHAPCPRCGTEIELFRWHVNAPLVESGEVLDWPSGQLRSTERSSAWGTWLWGSE